MTGRPPEDPTATDVIEVMEEWRKVGSATDAPVSRMVIAVAD